MEPTTTLRRPIETRGRDSRARRAAVEAIEGYLFVLPAVGLLALFLLIPSIWVFGLSLFRWDLISSSADFVGLANYQHLLQRDELFRQSLGQTLEFVLVTVPVGMAMGLGLAGVLNHALRGRGMFRSAIFVPYVMPLVATALIFGWIYQPDFGVLNAVLRLLHLPTGTWLGAPHTVLASIIVYSLWQHTGYTTVLFLAGLANIPPDLGEVAAVDGANRWQTFWKVTWPVLSPTTYFVLLISLIGSFKVVNQILILSPQGGPDNAAVTIGFYLYRQAFVSFRAGYAGAISVVLFVIILAVTAIQMRVTSRRVFYS